MELMVSAVCINGDDNLDIELRDPAGADLPPFSAGAHIDIRTPSGSLRQYSLCGRPEERNKYRICVRKDGASRGGSSSLHQDLRVRARVEVSAPRNLFPMPEARRYILVSAGIGITPIISMARHFVENGTRFEMHHFERSRARVAFIDELTSGALGLATTLHIQEDGANFRSTVPSWIMLHDPDAVVVACGPNGFLDLLGDRLENWNWSPDQFHSERFRPPEPVANAQAGNASSFEVQIASSGACFTVGPNDTIANVLLANGVAIDLSCEQGMCGACLTRVIAGTPDHRDMVLSEAERAANGQITLCCSRARSAVLTLDL